MKRWRWMLAGLVALILGIGVAFINQSHLGASAPPAAVNTKIIIDVPTQRLTLYRDGKAVATYPVAVGNPQTRSPRGEFTITQKAVWGDGFGTRWMRFSAPWGIYGIHGTNQPWSVGTVASHGCIRMYNRDVEALYAEVSVGTPVVLEGPTPYATIKRPMAQGVIGQDVVELQRLLTLAGVYQGTLDGVYSETVTQAVERFQTKIGEPVTGKASLAMIAKLQVFTNQSAKGHYLQ